MKLDFDSGQLRSFLVLLKSLETELLAYRLFYEFVRDSEKFPLTELTTRLAEAKAAVRGMTDAKYDEVLQTLADTADQASAQRALELLARWTPIGKPN